MIQWTVEVPCPKHMTTEPLIQKFAFKPYKRSFKESVSFGNGIWEIREGWILRLEDTEGRIGFGEIAPLPAAWGGESMAAIKDRLMYLAKQRLPLQDNIEKANSLPSLQAGISMAGLQLEGFFNNQPKNHLKVATFLPTDKATPAYLNSKLQEGYKTFKLKISGLSISAIYNLLEPLWTIIPEGTKLRLDANQSFSKNDCSQLLSYLKDKPIEFIEEPLKNPTLDSIRSLQDTTHIPLALDEQVGTLKKLHAAEAAKWPGIYVIKPSGLGNLYAFLKMRTASHGTFVYSTAFETVIGLNTLLQIANSENNPLAIGIGALDALRPDFLSPQQTVRPDLPAQWNISIPFEMLWNAL